MRAQTVDVEPQLVGSFVAPFRPGGKKLLAKGHVISDEDIRVLESEGMETIWVTELEEGEIGEDDAVCAVASEMGCGSFEIRLAAGGRANLLATENCCVLVDDELLKQINCPASVVIATSLNFSYAVAGQRIATVKSAPFAVAKEQLEAVIGILEDRGPILQAARSARPLLVLYTDPVNGERPASCSRTSCDSLSALASTPLAYPARKTKTPSPAACNTCSAPSRAPSWWPPPPRPPVPKMSSARP